MTVLEAGTTPLNRAGIERAARLYDASYDAALLSPAFRDPIITRGYLSRGELAEIVAWKSARQKTNVLKNPPATVAAVTRAAFSSIEPWLAVWILSYLTGVRARVASAILTVYDPARYTVIDVRAWAALEMLGLAEPLGLAALGSSDTVDFEQGDVYARYLDGCAQLATEAGVSLRTLDRCLWIVGKAGVAALEPPGTDVGS